ncbi:MAG: hypothetical protein QNJ43_05065 [Breoghania sp.]|nr:hypothetical protein [Breoghania sp.]
MIPRHAKIGIGLMMIDLMFSLSLSFRMMDHAVCKWFPIGTHFMWHVLNAVVIYMLLRVLVYARRFALHDA